MISQGKPEPRPDIDGNIYGAIIHADSGRCNKDGCFQNIQPLCRIGSYHIRIAEEHEPEIVNCLLCLELLNERYKKDKQS